MTVDNDDSVLQELLGLWADQLDGCKDILSARELTCCLFGIRLFHFCFIQGA
jgi:hypothetical protein